MGQQQLLLLVLGAIIVGVAIVVGMNMFSQNALSSNIDAVKQDCLNIAARAQEWYRKPAVLGGGSHVFTGVTFEDLGFGTGLTTTYTNDHGTYTITPLAQSITIVGETIETDADDLTWTVTYTAISPNTIPNPAIAQGT